MKRNTFNKALKHLKSTELDEKIQRLNEAPTNSMSGVYALNDPGFRLNDPDPERIFYPDVDGNWPAGIPGTPGADKYTRPAGFWSGGTDWDTIHVSDLSQAYLDLNATGTSTSSLIEADGTVKTPLPPNSRNFILGPLVDGYVRNHGYDDFTNIGYLQKDTRQFVLLASIPGHWDSNLRPSGYTPRQWNGSTITIYNANFTLAMATWFSDKITSNNYTANVPYFSPGGTPQIPQSPADCPKCPPGMKGGNGAGGAGAGWGSGGNSGQGSKQGEGKKGNQNDAGYPWGPDPELAVNYNLYNYLLKHYGMGAAEWYKNNPGLPPSSNPFLPSGAYVPLAGGASGNDLIAGSLSGPRLMDTSDPIRPSPRGPYSPIKYDPHMKQYAPSGPSKDPWSPTGLFRTASYQPQGELISESRQRILREIKQPVKVEEPQPQKLKKYRPNFAGRYTAQNTPDVTASPKSDEIVKAKNAAGQTWRTMDKHWSRYESTERMNIVYDNVGHGSQYWDQIVNENQMKKVMRDREVQEHLNIIAHEKAMLREDPLYESPFKKPIQEQETLQADSDPLFKKVRNRLKPVLDYPDKPSKLGYPDQPPPEMVNGMHPEYGQKADYYDKLDPHSANAMPSTGNPEIDAKVRRAKTLKKVLGKKA